MSYSAETMNIYPRIAPLERLAALATVALNDREEKRPDNARVVVGSRFAQFSRDGYLYYIEEEKAGEHASPLQLRFQRLPILEEEATTDVSDIVYALTQNENGTHITAENKNPGSPHLQEKAVTQFSIDFLTALTREHPQPANEILESTIKQRFTMAVGSYLFSATDFTGDKRAAFTDIGLSQKIWQDFERRQDELKKEAREETAETKSRDIQRTNSAINHPAVHDPDVDKAGRVKIAQSTMLDIVYEHHAHSDND
jgi:hypothetical protein